ncbi:hypothetical protein SLA2020_339920 [Shorea laevis]
MKTTSNQQTDQKYNLTQNQIEELVKSPKDQPVVSFPIQPNKTTELKENTKIVEIVQRTRKSEPKIHPKRGSNFRRTSSLSRLPNLYQSTGADFSLQADYEPVKNRKEDRFDKTRSGRSPRIESVQHLSSTLRSAYGQKKRSQQISGYQVLD